METFNPLNVNNPFFKPIGLPTDCPEGRVNKLYNDQIGVDSNKKENIQILPKMIGISSISNTPKTELAKRIEEIETEEKLKTKRVSLLDDIHPKHYANIIHKYAQYDDIKHLIEKKNGM